jgi:FkbM family methyltransferase
LGRDASSAPAENEGSQQSMSPFEPFNRQRPCRYATMLYNFHDRYIGRSLDVYGEYSEGEIQLFRQIIKPGHMVIDVGANIGAHTVFLAQQVGLEGSVLAVEPQRIAFQTLCANVAINSIPNVQCVKLAVGARAGVVRVPLLDYRIENNFGALNLESQELGETVPIIALDDLNLPKCDFIKIDVEGMEEQVVAGAVGTIARLRPILYVENDNGAPSEHGDRAKSDSLIRAIDALGYTLYWHVPAYFNPDNFRGVSENIFPALTSCNMLCVPREAPQEVDLQRVEVPSVSPR